MTSPAIPLLTEEVSVREALARVLEDAGIEFVFGMPGGHTGALFDALRDHEDRIRTVLVREESLAGVMAQVYGRLTGRPGVAIGQAAFMLGASVGALEAHLSGAPMLILTDRSVEGRFAHHGAYQSGSGEYGSWDARTAFSGFTSRTMVAPGGSASVQSLQLAIKHAVTGSGGSVALLFPLEALRGRVGPGMVPALYSAASYAAPPPARANDGSVEKVAALLAAAAAPVIVAGTGVHRAHAYEDLQGLAERAGAAVVTTAGGKGTIAETHPLALGVFGNFGTPAANHATATADMVLVVGSRLSPSDTANENPALLDPTRQRIVQVDIEPRNTGWTFPVGEVLLGDARVVLNQLSAALGDSAADRVGPERVAELRAQLGHFPAPEPPANGELLSPRWVVHELAALFPEDVVVCGDAGENRLFLTHDFQTRSAGSFIQAAGVGAMGYALPAALAAKLVMPSRPVAAVCGDGGFAMAMNGLLTALEQSISVVVVILNNSALGWVLHGQRDRPIACRFGDVDYTAVAAAMGAHASRVRTAEELRAAVPAALVAGRPAVIEVIVSQADTFRDVTSPLA